MNDCGNTTAVDEEGIETARDESLKAEVGLDAKAGETEREEE